MDLAAAKILKHADWSRWAGSVKTETGCFIEGEFLPAQGGELFETVNPATGEVIRGRS